MLNHEEAFVSVFVVPRLRGRYAEFLSKPKRRAKMTDRFCHLFDFVPHLATPVPRASALAESLRKLGAGDIAHVIGGRDGFDGMDLPLEEAINGAMADPGGVVISCVPGQLALLIQEFPPGHCFLLRRQS